MDLQLGAMSGLEAISAIRREDHGARIVVLTMAEGDEDIRRALDAGAVTYLLKDTAFDDLVRIVRDVHAGKRPEIGTGVKKLLHSASRSALSSREIQVLELIRKGLRNRDIAAASLGIGEETVQTHIKNILAKLNAQDRTAAVDIALRRGIIHIR
jgi:DNA-binding NarL/FixJ family response regulator